MAESQKGILFALAGIVPLACLATGCIVPTDNLPEYVRAASMAQRNDWAKPLNARGLSNFYRVDDHLYRGAEPDREGYAELARMGVRTVVNLRADRDYRSMAEAAGLNYVHIRANVWDFKDEHIVQFLRAAGDRSRGPVFVNCMRGSDRTGAMVCIYRVAVDGWTIDEAIAEMTTGGYGFDSSLGFLVEHLRRLDISGLADKAGI